MISRAKITPPNAHSVIARTRLHRRLARKGVQQITWIVGPPGAGKTSLAVGFIQQQATSHLWYQVDEGDRDPATLFACLSEAIRRVSRRRKPVLLAFSSEYRQGLLVFSRRYFEGFFDRLLPGSILVLDNYQEISLEAPTQEILREGLSVLPPGFQVLVLSRQPPPACFAQLQASGRLEVLGWEELRMTPRESMVLLRARTDRLGAEQASELCRRADGWPAGLVLMAAEHRSVPAWQPEGGGREVLFDYFANEVLEGADLEQRALLLQVAVLPRCTAAQARELTGLKSAGVRLKALARSGYFTEAHGLLDPTYAFHPLFREFLWHRAAAVLAPQDWTELLCRAATLLERDSQFVEAFELLRRAEAVERQIQLILAQARSMLAQGQHQTLATWLAALPPSTVQAHAWLSLWLGHCLLSTDLQGSRGHLERAFAAFERDADPSGQLLAWCAAVDTWLYAWDDYSRLDAWIQWLDRHRELFERMQDASILELVSVGMAWAIVHRKPDHPDSLLWMQRAERILREGSHPQIQLRAGTAAFMFRFWAGEQVACEVLATGIQRLAHAQQEPMALITSYWAEAGMLAWNRVTPARCRELIEAGLALGLRFGIHLFDFMFHGNAAALAIGEGDHRAAGEALVAMGRCIRGHNSWAYFHYLSSWDAYTRDALPAALAHAELAVQHSKVAGMPASDVMNGLVLTELLFESGRQEEARIQAELVEALFPRVGSPVLEMMYHQGAARRGLLTAPGDLKALEHLRQALALGRTFGFLNHLWRVPAWTARLCAIALEQGIEVAFVQRLIRAHDLRPDLPPLLCSGWPWELRVTTLGRFAIQRDGKELVFTSKAPWKILLLLKALIAAGPSGIGEERLADWLWPDSEGDAGQQSLETGLHRLRQMLGVGGAVLLREGHLVLDPCRCWVDAHAFETCLETGRLEQALALYRGPFLEDLEEPWGRHYRESLKEKFLQAVLAQGGHMEAATNQEGAVSWYERGVQAVPSTELLYRRIMLCHHARGQRAEGLRAYDRCRTALWNILEVEPSLETEKVASALRG
jgi:LuxR family maltose regulon positive regulatory protein